MGASHTIHRIDTLQISPIRFLNYTSNNKHQQTMIQEVVARDENGYEHSFFFHFSDAAMREQRAREAIQEQQDANDAATELDRLAAMGDRHNG